MSLPEGYHFIYGDDIDAKEVVDLYDPHDWGNSRSPELWDYEIQESLAAVGVRSAFGQLVGAGLLLGPRNEATLSELIVHPEHRKLGVGTALVEERVKIADNNHISPISVYLSTANSLKIYYRLGFKKSIVTGSGLIRTREKE